MRTEYHITLTQEALAPYFAPAALAEVVEANTHQDALPNLLGGKPHFHFYDNRIQASLAYVEENHRLIAHLADGPEGGLLQRIAFGRLCHAVQDFYAHSNYVDLWAAALGSTPRPPAEAIDGLRPALLAHPDLHTGTFVLLRDLIYYIPLLGALAHRIHVPPGSHEAMNLDTPSQGWQFEYALAAARQRTRFEYDRAAHDIRQHGGDAALREFTGLSQS